MLIIFYNKCKARTSTSNEYILLRILKWLTAFAENYWLRVKFVLSKFSDLRVSHCQNSSALNGIVNSSVEPLLVLWEGKEERLQWPHSAGGPRFLYPMVFSSCGGMGQEASTALNKLASMLADKRKEDYSHTITLLRMRISFALIRTSIVCLRGTRLRPQFASSHFPSDAVLQELRQEE